MLPSRPPSPTLTSRKQNIMKIINNRVDPSCLALSEVFRTCTLLTNEQKIEQTVTDPVLKHLYESKVFKFMIWWTFFVFGGLATAIVITIAITPAISGGLPRVYLSDVSASVRLHSLEFGVPAAIFMVPFTLAILLPLSRRLS